MVILRAVPESEGPAAEIKYIRIARSLGMNLVNATDGGDGVTMTPETRKKIGAAHSHPCSPAEKSRRARVLRENLKALPAYPRSGTGRLNFEQIKRLHTRGMTQTQIADTLGTDQGTVSRIVRFGTLSKRQKDSHRIS